MELTAYLSVLFIPLFLGIAVLIYLTWQILKDRKNEKDTPRKTGPFVFAVVFWLLFVGFYLWRTWPTE